MKYVMHTKIRHRGFIKKGVPFMNYKVQNVIFPSNEKSEYRKELFFKNGGVVYDDEKKIGYIAKYSNIDFSTYFNSFSQIKWKKYTSMQSVSLRLTIRGHFKVKLVGYKDTEGCIQQFSFGSTKFDNYEPQCVVIPFAENDCTILGFEISTFSDCEIIEGGYYIDLPRELNEVRLAMATTTFCQEQYIIPNIDKIKSDIIDSEEDISKNFHVFVIDNGRTLQEDLFQSEQIDIVPNVNAGGSGGFCRGMMCAIDMNPKPTHLLLMDDDVMIMPESIIRTYNLYRCVNEEWKDAFVSGAMLSYEKIVWQEEDMGYVLDEGWFAPVKQPLCISEIHDLVMNDGYQWEEHDNQYAPWWYCCIPMKYVRNDNLPLPLFVRGDDSEFSIRNHCKIMTMNSIAIWHKGFAAKHFASKEYYQVMRNSFIAQAISGEFQQADFMVRLKKYFMTEINRFNYKSANQLCDALEDFLNGPDIISQNNGALMMKEQGKKNEQLCPVEEFGIHIDYDTLYNGRPRSLREKVFMKLTVNGHRMPTKLLKKEPGIIPYDLYTWYPERACRRKSVLAVSDLDRTAVMRNLDKQKYKKVMNRWNSLVERYQKEGDQIRRQYYDRRKEFMSREFWNKYLEIGE